MPAFRVHVVGCPRSGTTLLTELMRHAYSFCGKPLHEQSLFEPIPGAQYPYLSKKPSDTHRIGEVLRSDRELYVIAVVRDPRSVVASRHWSSQSGDYYVGFARWRRAMVAIEQMTSNHRCIRVSYESLVRDPAGVQRQIEKRLGFLTRKRSFESFAEDAQQVPEKSAAALNGVRVFDSSRIADWKNHLSRVRGELDQNPDLPDWLIKCGYESDHSWMDPLMSVDPAGTTSKPLPNASTNLLKQLEPSFRYWRRVRSYRKARQKLANYV